MSNRLEEDRRSFLFGSNADFIAELYARYLEDPASVDSSWVQFFSGLHDDARSIEGELRGASWSPRELRVEAGLAEPAERAEEGNGHAAAAPTAAEIRRAQLDALRAIMLIRAYRVRGHLIAKLDPLRLEKREYHPELDYKT